MTLAEPVLAQSAQIVSAYEIQHGSALRSDMTASTTYLEVEDLDDFADAGGEFYLAALEDSDQTSEPLAYVGLDRTLGRVLLAATWSADFPLFLAGDSVWISPIATERRADVALDGEEDQIVVARIPYALAANIPLGIRDSHAGEWVRVRVTDYGYALDDALLEYPKTDPESISITDPDTGEEIGGIGGDASFDTVTADEIISPSVPRRNWLGKTIYVDPLAGDDANDGTAFPPVLDTFSRVVAGGLGTSDTGQAWTSLANGGNILEVNGTDARIRLNGTNLNTLQRVAFAPLDYEVLATLNLNGVPTAGTAAFGVLLRAVDSSTTYLAGIQIAATTVLGEILSKVGGTWTSLGTSASFGTYSDATIVGVEWQIRARVQTNAEGGSDLKLRVWRSIDVEPDAWTVEVNDASGVLQVPAGAGIGARSGGSYADTGTFPIGFYRDFSAYSIDAEGNAIDVAEGGVGPYATIAAALEEAGEWNDADVRIVLNGIFDESIFISGLTGGGRLFIDGANVTTLYGIVRLYGIHHFLGLSNLTIQDTGETGVSGTVEVRTSRHVEVTNVKFQTNTAHAYNVFATEGADVRVGGCQLSGASSYCVQVSEQSTALAVDNSGSAPNGSYRSSVAILWIDGTKPTGATTTATGGQIFGTTTTSGGGSAPPTSNKVTKTYSPNGSRTWRPEWAWREDNRDVYQGEYAGSGGISRGAVFYGTKLNVAGKNADSGKIFVKRKSSGGQSGGESVYLFAHDLASQPNNDSAPAIKDGPTKLGTLAWGEGKWFTIPTAWVQSMLDGTSGRRGFGLYHASASPYVIASPYNGGGDTWKVKFTYH